MRRRHRDHEASVAATEACDALARRGPGRLFEAAEAGRLGVTARAGGLRAAGAPAVIVVAADADPELVAQALRRRRASASC